MKTFSERVVEAALSVPPGRVTTYGDLARACGGGGQAARSVTGILGRAYERGEKNIPFHRVVYANGQVWRDERYDAARAKLYEREGISVDERGYVQDFHSIRWTF